MKNMYTSVLSRWLMLLFLLSSQTLLAQTAPTIQWQRFYGGSTKQAPNSDYLIAGGNVLRLASDGTQKWSKSLATYSADNIAILSNGNNAVLAHDSYYYFKWAVILLSPAGDIISTQSFETYTRPNNGYPQSNPFDIVQGPDGGITVLGTVSYGREGSGTTVYKFGVDGSFIKQTSIQHPLPPNLFRPNSIGNRILSLVDGYLVVGSAYGKGWAAKLNSSLDVIWSEQYSAAQSITDAIVSPFDSQAFVATGRNTDQTVTLTISPTNPSVNNTAITYRPSLQFVTLNNYPYEGSQTNSYPLPKIVSNNANSFEILDEIDQRSGDIRITSFGAANQTRWTKILGGSAADVAGNVITTQDGGYLLSGLTQSKDGDIQGNTPNNVSGWLVKLAPGTPLTLSQPNYDCDRGSITFITTGGDGSPITYSAPGVSRQSATSNAGFVEQGLRNDPKPITITATQSGYSTSYVFDFDAYCTGLITPTLKEPIPDQSRPVNVQIISNIIPINSYFNGVPSFKSFRPLVNYRADGLPPGLILFDSSNPSQQLAYIGGTPTVTGTYSVTVTAYVSNAPAPQPSVSTTFRITITDSPVVTPPPTTGGTLTLTQPTYDCSTGAITFNTTGGDGSTITYSAPGITRSSATSNTGTVEQGLRNDPKVITITAMQSGQTTSYSFDLKAFCNGTTPTTPTMHPDMQPLVDLYNATNGPSWKNKANWLTGNSPCNWFGVSCNANGRVTEVNLGYNNLNGTLPASLGNLSELQRFVIFTEPLLSGTLPASLGNLSKLQLLEIEYTQISGSIPENLGNLQQLTQLFLAQNRLSGTIPESLGNLSNLNILYLFGNELTGSLPNSLANLPKLQTLHLYNNKLSGCIPAAYTALCGKDVKLTSNVALSGGGDFAAFCANPTQNCGPNKLLTLTQPTYNCSTGAITFNFANGDGTAVTYTAPGISRSSAASNTGVVEQGLRNDPKTITITAMQNGYSTSYNFDLKAFCGGNTPTPSSTLKLLAPVVDCSSRQVTLVTSGGDGSAITFNTPTITRSSATSPTGTVDLCIGAQPPVLQAMQSGFTATYESFDFVKLCPAYLGVKPLVVSQIPDINVPLGQYTSITLQNYFTNPTNTINRYVPVYSFTHRGTPAGSSLDDQSFIVHTFAPYAFLYLNTSVSGVYSITVTGKNECDPAATSTFRLIVNPASGSGPFTLVAPTYNCSTGAFTFNYTGGNGSPVEFQAAGITGWTTNPNQFVDRDSRTANDVKPFTLMARQNGQVVTYTWDLKAACGRSARMAAEAGQGLQLTVKGNPVGNTAIVDISGVEGQAVVLDLLNASGHVLEQRHIEQAGVVEEQRFELQRQPTGVLFLRAQSGQQQQTVKLIKQ